MVRILVVDDYRDVADSTAALLSEDGHEVRVAYTPSEAHATAEAFKPDLLITEAMLFGYPPRPEFCGFSLGQEIMEKHTCRGIVLSTQLNKDHITKAKRHGFAHFVLKPFDPEAFSVTVAQVLIDNA